jgi:hypothetical protein
VRTAQCNEKGGQQIAGRLVVHYRRIALLPRKGYQARAISFSDRRRA